MPFLPMSDSFILILTNFFTNKNFYTARMLLLLESQFLYNEELFNKCVEEIIDNWMLAGWFAYPKKTSQYQNI
jgi:diacylglycerol kinase